MRFSVIFIFIIVIAAMTAWQNWPQSDPFEEAGEKVIKELKREAALREARESLALDERIKETKKLTRKHPKLLEQCLESGDYKRSNLHIHEFSDGGKAAFCVSGGGIDLENFVGTIYYQHEKSVNPQVIEVPPGPDGLPGFDSGTRAVSFKFDGFYLDEKSFFNYAWLPALRVTYNCSVITKECMQEKRLRCAFDKKDLNDEELLEKNKVDEQYLARIEEDNKKAYEDYFSAISGNRDLRKFFLSTISSSDEEASYDLELLSVMRASIKRLGRAGCLY